MPKESGNWKMIDGQWGVALLEGGTWATYICGAGSDGKGWRVIHIDVVKGGTHITSIVQWVGGLIWKVQ